MLFIRKAAIGDLSDITNIIESAKIFLKSQNIDQWQNGYPNQEQARVDIAGGQCYVLICNNEVAAVGTITTDVDPSYTTIQGSWRKDSRKSYASLHRLAVSERFRGKHLAQELLSGMIMKCKELGFVDVRVDTHKQNKVMQALLVKNYFEYRGVIYKNENRSSRNAYQLLLH
ncbi:KLTH0H00198p [Lachancea thermotolerans CBS 6340]|uniref:KLTH0H00198p n=1 Tax=Lachancea thermotolerans (strain ATCC 56472 / CBS 6340 / NRRL Y-8284) TaxID=559295 RepID=C5E1W6_LACTC|nr:KLTH0H00198p [Lachancea thermotolerans CBS 6340]CAR30027.1 KLTH0H00198p [Lachancea thermotolerans CBS 6340]